MEDEKRKSKDEAIVIVLESVQIQNPLDKKKKKKQQKESYQSEYGSAAFSESLDCYFLFESTVFYYAESPSARMQMIEEVKPIKNSKTLLTSVLI